MGEADKEICRRMDKTLGPMPLDGERPECKYLLHIGRELSEDRFSILPDDAEPDDDSRESAFYGIADVIGLKPTEGIDGSVYDFKTGSFWVDKPEWNWQLLLPAIGLWTAAGRPERFTVRCGIVYVRDLVGEQFRSECIDIGADILSNRLAWLRRLVAKHRVARPESVTLYEGKHCQYCPARARCPAKIGALANAIMTVGHPHGSDQEVVRSAFALIESKPQLDKAAKELIKINGLKVEANGKTEYNYDLGDSRTAVVSVDAKGKEKLFTRKTNSKTDLGVEGD